MKSKKLGLINGFNRQKYNNILYKITHLPNYPTYFVTLRGIEPRLAE